MSGFDNLGAYRQSFLTGRAPRTLQQQGVRGGDLTPFGFGAVRGFQGIALPRLMERLGYRTWQVGKVSDRLLKSMFIQRDHLKTCARKMDESLENIFAKSGPT